MYLLFFISPTRGNLHINKFWKPPSLPCDGIHMQRAQVFLFVCLNLCLTAEYPHVVRCCGNSRRRLSCWLCTIKADCIFFFPRRDVSSPPRTPAPPTTRNGVFERRAQSRASLSHSALITFHPDLEIAIHQVGKGLSQICLGAPEKAIKEKKDPL